MSVGAAYFIAGRLGLGLALVHPSVTVIWAPTGIALAAMLLLGRRLWPAVFAAAFFVNWTTAAGALVSLGIATGNTLEAIIGSILAERLARGRAAFDSANGVLAFAATAGLFAPSLSATIGVASLCLGGVAGWDQFAKAWFAWFAGDMGGALVLAPFLVVWARAPRFAFDPARAIEIALVLAATAGLGLVVFGGRLPYTFLGLVPLIWSSLRLDLRATVTATLLMATIAVSQSLQGKGPFLRPVVEEPLLPLMAFLVVSSVGALAVGALMVERRRSEEELRRLAQIVASSQDAIVGAASDGTVTSWNSAAEQLYGEPAAAMLGRTIRVGHGAEDTQRILSRLASGARREVFDAVHQRKDGSTARLSVAVSPVHDAAGRVVGVASVARDVSDQHRIEELRKQAAELGLENRRVEESAQQRSRFVSHVSHELRTPLTAIVGFTDLLQDGRLGPLTEIQRRCLADIDESCELLMRLVNEVLDLALLEAGRMSFQPERVDVGRIVGDVRDALLPISTEKRISVSVRSDAALNAELLDPGRLRQVLYNFLTNALKFTPAGGGVEVRALLDGPERWVLEVQDSGNGVPVESEHKLFREFERLANGPSSERGIGLGLAITKRIVEAQGGSVGYRPAHGGGSVFLARLPRALREGGRL